MGLRIFSQFSPDHKDLGLKEIAQTIKANEASVYRYTNTLVGLGYLKKDSRTKRLSLDQEAFYLGQRLVKSFSLRQVVRPIVDEFYNKYKVSIDVAILKSRVLLQLYNRTDVDSYYALIDYNPRIIGKVIHCLSIAKAILAFLPEDEMLSIIDQVRYIKRTDKSIADRVALLTDLRKTKKRGYAINDEEFAPGLISIAAPFINLETGRPVGAVSFDFYARHLSVSNIERKYAAIVLELGKAISEVIQ